MVFGIEIYEVLSFLRQLGLALAGAAALWGIILSFKKGKPQAELMRHLLKPYLAGIFLALSTWLLLLLPELRVEAHEGIAYTPKILEIEAALQMMTPLALLLLLISLFGFWAIQKRTRARIFYAISLTIVAVIISTPAWTGAFTSEQIFLVGHGFHSIMTLGTVIVVDILFSLSLFFAHLKKAIYSLLPLISKVIWVGLGIDFLSVSLIFDDYLVFNDKFFFMQTVIGILIINGMLLSGPLTEKIMSGRVSKRAQYLINISGIVSFVSWLTNTSLDYVQNITLSYMQLLGGYALVIFTILIIHHVIMEWRPVKQRRISL